MSENVTPASIRGAQYKRSQLTVVLKNLDLPNHSSALKWSHCCTYMALEFKETYVRDSLLGLVVGQF